MIFMHSVLRPTLPLPNLHISIHVALLQSEISLTTLTSSSPEQSVIWNFPISETRFLFSSHFALTWTWDGWFNKRNSSIPLKSSLLLTITPTMGNTSSSLLSPDFILPPLDPPLPPFSVTSLNVRSLNLSGEIFFYFVTFWCLPSPSLLIGLLKMEDTFVMFWKVNSKIKAQFVLVSVLLAWVSG